MYKKIKFHKSAFQRVLLFQLTNNQHDVSKKTTDLLLRCHFFRINELACQHLLYQNSFGCGKGFFQNLVYTKLFHGMKHYKKVTVVDTAFYRNAFQQYGGFSLRLKCVFYAQYKLVG